VLASHIFRGMMLHHCIKSVERASEYIWCWLQVNLLKRVNHLDSLFVEHCAYLIFS
jgi:hypothetical protein